MIATFYLIPESFKVKNVEAFLKGLYPFLGEHSLIQTYKHENKIYILNDIYSVIIDVEKGITLSQYLYEVKVLDGKQQEAIRLAKQIFQKYPHCSKTLNDIKLKLTSNDENSCTGIISFTPIAGVASESQIVYDNGTWLQFRRSFLGRFPRNCNYFIDECVKYYPNFFFHANNYSSVKRILSNFSNKIIYHLSALHDVFPDILKISGDLTKQLSLLTIQAMLDESASVEGSSKFRKSLKFDFKETTKNGLSVVKLVCEAHLKLVRSDISGDSTRYYNRIYFHLGRPSIHGGKVLIAHIGEHL